MLVSAAHLPTRQAGAVHLLTTHDSVVYTAGHASQSCTQGWAGVFIRIVIFNWGQLLLFHLKLNILLTFGHYGCVITIF